MDDRPNGPENRTELVALSAGGEQRDPTPGYRHHASGVLSSVGNEGSVCSAAAYGTNGMNLNFTVTWLNPGSANTRGYGFQLRCLSE